MSDHDEFAALPEVQYALRHYERNPIWDYGKGNVAQVGASALKVLHGAGDLDAFHAAILLGGAQAADGSPLFAPSEATEAAFLLRDLRELLRGRESLLLRITQYRAPRGKRSAEKPARQQLVLRLALAWIESDRGRPTITHDPISGEPGGRFIAACLHSVSALSMRLRPDARSIDSDMRTLARNGLLPPLSAD